MKNQYNSRSVRKRVVLFALALAGTSGGCGLIGGEPLAVVEQVDIERYTGTWYEIAKYPNGFQRGCVDVTAEYALRNDGTVSVLNTCGASDGTVARTIEGWARVDDTATNAKLTVYFFFPFGAPYWIIDLDTDYQYAVVGEPTRRYLWILSRTPTLDAATYDEIVARLPDKGYDPERLEMTPQSPEEMP